VTIDRIIRYVLTIVAKLYTSQKLKELLITPHTQTLAAHFFKSWDHTVRMSTSKKHT